VIELLDALAIERAIFAGFDWGARAGCVAAALSPERCAGLVSVNGYLINNLERNKLPLPPKAKWGWWYQYYFGAPGEAGAFQPVEVRPG
jgi:pimeloyl-ACP methyl ester carboxylesterase